MPEVSSSSDTPLLRPIHDTSATHPETLAILLGRATGRRGPSMLVRETAARHLHRTRSDWSYSGPIVALDMAWNVSFVILTAIMLACTARETPQTPIRVWLCGYAAQCGVHLTLVWIEYRRRRRRSTATTSHDVEESDEDQEGHDADVEGSARRSSVTRRCESVNTMASFLWWIIGFYWVVTGGEQLLQNAPHLYWLSVVFLAFDVFFAIFCVVLACLIGIALCCCLPCIIAILYAVIGQEGASEADLSMLPKYRFQMLNDEEKPSVGAGKMVLVEPSSGYLADERILLTEDAECCVCLSGYENGTELHTLPCNHHFHSACISKWLKMNATCPLCKFNILKGNEQV